MRICISIAEHEVEMAHRWMDWVSELGGTDGHSLHLIPVSGLDISALLPKANRAFGGRVMVQKDEESETSDWQAKDLVRSASGPNSAFRQVAWDTYMNKRGPYFWCELDCIPTRKDWLDALEIEYKCAGKPFMGAKVEIESVPPHLSGNAIYPTNVPELAPMIVQRLHWVPKGQSQKFELAFDVAGAKDVLPKAHFTKLIQHIFRHKGFGGRAEFDATIDPNAVVFHSCKDGSIYKYLRENLSGRNVETNPSVVGTVQNSDSGEGFISHQAAPAQNYFDGSNETTRKDYEKLCEPAPSQPDELITIIGRKETLDAIKTEGSPSVVTKTFPMNAGEVRSCPYCANPIDKWCPYCAAWKDPNYDQKLQSVIAQNAVIRNGLPAMSPPWENREDTERDIKMLCDALALFAKAPIYKSRVRNALREAKIIK